MSCSNKPNIPNRFFDTIHNLMNHNCKINMFITSSAVFNVLIFIELVAVHYEIAFSSKASLKAAYFWNGLRIECTTMLP